MTDCNKDEYDGWCPRCIQLMWIAIGLAYLAIGGLFILGTQHSRDADSVLASKLNQVERMLGEGRGVQ